jgi:hypothetical protein
LAANPVGELVEEGLFTSITADLGVDDDTIRGSLIQKAEDFLGNRGGKLGKAVATGLKELYMLPGSKGYQAAVAATQYGDFVARYTKYKYDTEVGKKVSAPTPAQQEKAVQLRNRIEETERIVKALKEGNQEQIARYKAEIARGKDLLTFSIPSIQDRVQIDNDLRRLTRELRDLERDRGPVELEKEIKQLTTELERLTRNVGITHRRSTKAEAINEALAAFIYYDIPQPKYLQALNDSGLVMFTKFFLRIQPIVARMYSQNPASAVAVLLLQKNLLGSPFNENIMNYGMGDGLTNKFTNPLNLPGKVTNTLNPLEPAALDWLLGPFGL